MAIASHEVQDQFYHHFNSWFVIIAVAETLTAHKLILELEAGMILFRKL